MKAFTIFISYAHQDEAFKDQLTQQLKGLQRQGLIAPWHDRCIDGGDDWRSGITEAIDTCDLALLLVSPAFIASDFIYAEELARLMARRQNEGIRIVPIIIKPCAWKHEKPIESLQARPRDGAALITFPEETGARAQAWVDIVEEIAHWAKARARASQGSPARSVSAVPPVRTGSPLARDLVYISYRHRDRRWHTQLRSLLDADPRLRELVWDDTKIPAGGDVWQQIEQHIGRARIIVMLGSDDYFAPDSVPMRCEVQPALAAHARQELVVLWFPVRPVSVAATPVRDIMAATGPSPDPLEGLAPEEQFNALRKVYLAVLDHLGLPPLSEPLEPQSTKWEPPMLLTRIPEPSDRSGLQKIAGCDDESREVDVVFIHGLGGDAWTTWMANQNDIGTFWPNWLAADLPRTGLWTLGYSAEGSKWKEESMPLADRGNQVLDLLANEGLGERPLVFITHSMGGIVAKQILRHAESFGVDRWEAVARQTRGIAFIATPHSGAHVANFAELARAVYRTNEQVKELTAHDPRLRELHGWFLKYQREHQVICRTYCEKREVRPEIPLLGIRLPKGILVVDETSAEPNIPGERAVPLDEDHISICKPPSREAQIYKGMLRFLKDCRKEAESRPH